MHEEQKGEVTPASITNQRGTFAIQLSAAQVGGGGGGFACEICRFSTPYKIPCGSKKRNLKTDHSPFPISVADPIQSSSQVVGGCIL